MVPLKPVPTRATRLQGVGSWVLLAGVALGSTYGIQRFFGADAMEVPDPPRESIEAVETLLNQQSVQHLLHAVRELERHLARLPGDGEGLLLVELALRQASEGSLAEERLKKLQASAVTVLEAAMQRDAGAAEPRFLLSRILAAPGASKTDKARAEALFAEARRLAEKRWADAPGDLANAFTLARILRSRPEASEEDYRLSGVLIRKAVRPESELRLGPVGRVPIAVSLRRIEEAVDKGLIGQARMLLNDVFAEDRANRPARLLYAEMEMESRPDSDVEVPGRDEGLVGLLQPVLEDGAATPARAWAYMAALRAAAGAEPADPAFRELDAKALYAKAVAAKFDAAAEAESLIARKRPGPARLLLTAVTMLEKGDAERTARVAKALVLRAELQLARAVDGFPPESAEAQLTTGWKAAEGAGLALPGRYAAYMSALVPDEAVAREWWDRAVKAGMKLTEDLDALDKAGLGPAGRFLLAAATERGLALTVRPGPDGSLKPPSDAASARNDSELWYRFGRTFATAGRSDFRTAARYYRKAVDVGATHKTPGAGKAALSIARIQAGDGDRAALLEARNMALLARACGIETMDITSVTKVLENIDNALAAATSAPGHGAGLPAGHHHGDGHDHGPGDGHDHDHGPPAPKAAPKTDTSAPAPGKAKAIPSH